MLAESKLSMEEATHGKVSEEVIIVCACCTVSSTIVFHTVFYQPVTS